MERESCYASNISCQKSPKGYTFTFTGIISCKWSSCCFTLLPQCKGKQTRARENWKNCSVTTNIVCTYSRHCRLPAARLHYGNGVRAERKERRQEEFLANYFNINQHSAAVIEQKPRRAFISSSVRSHWSLQHWRLLPSHQTLLSPEAGELCLL